MANRYWVGGSGTWNTTSTANWSAASGGASGASAPGAADAAIFDAGSGSTYTVTLGENVTVLSVTTNLAVGLTVDFGTNKITVAGNAAQVYRGSGIVAYLGTPVVDFSYAGGTGTRTLTPGGAATSSNPATLNILGGTDIVSLAAGSTGVYNNLNFTGFAGTLQYISTGSSLNIYGSLTISSGMTLPAVQTGGIVFRAATGVQQITTAGKTFNIPLTFSGAAGTWEFQDALTQEATRAFTLTAGTVKLRHSATSTVGVFTTTGTTQKFLSSTLAGTQATLSQASGTVNATYLTIQDIDATGGATWIALVSNNNVDAGNVTGWDFGAVPAYDGETPMALRSFTERRIF